MNPFEGKGRGWREDTCGEAESHYCSNRLSEELQCDCRRQNNPDILAPAEILREKQKSRPRVKSEGIVQIFAIFLSLGG
jgi:hypothetical protein